MSPKAPAAKPQSGLSLLSASLRRAPIPVAPVEAQARVEQSVQAEQIAQSDLSGGARPEMFGNPTELAAARQQLVALAEAGQLFDVPIDLIDPDPDQPRKRFDPEAMQTLTDSISAIGLIQPVELRRHPTIEGRYMIVVGERRYRAHRDLGKPTVWCTIKEGLSVEDVLVRQLTENSENNRCPPSPWEEAESLGRLLKFYPSQVALCEKRKFNVKWVSKRMVLFSLPSEIKELNTLGILTDIETGLELGRLYEDDRKAALQVIAKARAEGKIQRDAVKQARLQATGKAKPPKGIIPAFETSATLVGRHLSAAADGKGRVSSAVWSKGRKSVKVELVFDSKEAWEKWAAGLVRN